jgi:hypothetical protein
MRRYATGGRGGLDGHGGLGQEHDEPQQGERQQGAAEHEEGQSPDGEEEDDEGLGAHSSGGDSAADADAVPAAETVVVQLQRGDVQVPVTLDARSSFDHFYKAIRRFVRAPGPVHVVRLPKGDVVEGFNTLREFVELCKEQDVECLAVFDRIDGADGE